MWQEGSFHKPTGLYLAAPGGHLEVTWRGLPSPSWLFGRKGGCGKSSRDRNPLKKKRQRKRGGEREKGKGIGETDKN